MARERQKKKNRSSISKVKAGHAGRTKTGKKKVNFMGNDIIAKNWDTSLTLSQNYNRLGLSSRLNAPTGGIEKKTSTSTATRSNGASIDPLAIKPTRQPSKTIKPTETRVERDPETGRILRVIQDSTTASKRTNPLNDPLNDLSSSSPSPEPPTRQIPATYTDTSVVPALEAQARIEEEQLLRTKRPRQQSKREEEWIQRLVDAHGDDYAAMARNRKLNVMQQSEGDIRRRVGKWIQKHDQGGS